MSWSVGKVKLNEGTVLFFFFFEVEYWLTVILLSGIDVKISRVISSGLVVESGIEGSIT